MSEARWLVSLAILISVLITFASLEIDAQPTIDDGTSYETCTSDVAVRLIRKDLEDVKNILGSIQHFPTTSTSNSDRISALTCKYTTPCYRLLLHGETKNNTETADRFLQRVLSNWLFVNFTESRSKFILGNYYSVC